MRRVDGWQALVYSLEAAPIDSMSCAHNTALLGLSEDFPEVHSRDYSGVDGVCQHLACPHRRQLVHITCTKPSCWHHASGACKLFAEEQVAEKVKQLAEFKDWRLILAA